MFIEPLAELLFLLLILFGGFLVAALLSGAFQWLDRKLK